MSLPQISDQPLAHLCGTRVHLLIDHLRSVEALARAFGSAFGAAEAAALAGLWHDLGKYGPEFQNRIRQKNGYAAHIEGDHGSDRDHASAGAIRARDCLGPVGWLLAFAIAGHHTGLANRVELDQRLRKRRPKYEAAMAHGGTEVEKVPALPEKPGLVDLAEVRRWEMWTRMVFSALCDADFLDTEAFYSSDRSVLRPSRVTVGDLDRVLTRSEESKAGDLLRAGPLSRVNQARAEVREACLRAAQLPPGVFSLTVPTGGGKTRSSLAFALRHAVAHGKRRVVVVIPYTSIIEQTAEVYRDILGTDAVLEHHSALDSQKQTPRNRIACENWDAPVVVTTTVQLLESLVARRPSKCRKVHNLANSVIVLDEAQSLPPKYLIPILDLLHELVRSYGVTLVFATATQPAFRKDSLPTEARALGFDEVREIVPCASELFTRLQRVRVRWPADMLQPISYEQLAREVAREPHVLVVVHKRKDAQDLCLLLDKCLGNHETKHLSALMCPAHRSQLLAAAKAHRGPQVMVATQLIESGVDISFPIVYRAAGGLDALAQAAGRCNREGDLLELGELRIFVAPTAPPPGVPQLALNVTRNLCLGGRRPCLNDPEVFAGYFRRFYACQNLDEEAIQQSRENLQFENTSKKMRIIEDSWSAPLIIPFDAQAKKLLESLEGEGPDRHMLRKLQRYTVQVDAKSLDQWVSAGAVQWVGDTVACLRDEEAYSDRFGLMPSKLRRSRR